MMTKSFEITEAVAYEYSSDSTLEVLSNGYQHDRV